jgi:ATP-binding cassette subfamily B protein
MEVWRMVPGKYKVAFAGAAVLMALASATAVAVPVALGRLVDDMSAGVFKRVTNEELFWTAGELLGLIAILVVLRELFNVFRRFLVENVCTRIDKHLSVRVVSHLLKVELRLAASTATFFAAWTASCASCAPASLTFSRPP